MTTKERNRRRKIKKRAELATNRELSGSYVWGKFDTMTYSKKVTK